VRELRIGLVLATAAILSGCAQSAPPPLLSSTMIFLTRDGCVYTDTMRANLNAALTALKLPTNYQFVDADTLADTDPRRGYGTPTVLYSGRDLFGMPEPPVQENPPT
jgi:hypothetical protein